jgi:4-hydroxy-tetrahydrodipicolinate reductase
MAAEIGIGVAGGGGRMGRMLLAEISASKGCRVAGAIERAGSRELGRDLGHLAGIGALDLKLGSDAKALFKAADVIIDFTSPETSVAHAKLAASLGKAMVIGTTGLSEAQAAALRAAAKKSAIVWSPNMSVAVNLLLKLVEAAAAALGPAYDIEIFEMHHRMKADAPSGTALALGRAAAKARGVDLAKASQRGRDGVTGPRRSGDIGFAVLRGGDEAGEHRVIFAGAGETLTLTHRATSRAIFARGAVLAALWAAKQKPGLYAMADVLRN